jgi:hypothetical protein
MEKDSRLSKLADPGGLKISANLMIEAVPAQATGSLFERPVATPLQETFASVWVHRMPEAAAPPIIVAPDGTIDLQ